MILKDVTVGEDSIVGVEMKVTNDGTANAVTLGALRRKPRQRFRKTILGERLANLGYKMTIEVPCS